jgi:hypothetical protein
MIEMTFMSMLEWMDLCIVHILVSMRDSPSRMALSSLFMLLHRGTV